jgi:ABC-type transport system substrate-binding protein
MGDRRATVVLGVQRTEPGAEEIGALLREQLEEIGVTVDVRPLDDAFAEARSDDTELNALLGGWVPAYVDPEDAVYSVVSPRSPFYFWPVWFEDEELFDRIDAAREVTGAERPAAWAAVDDETSAQAAFVPLSTLLSRPQLFSGRVGCQAFLPFFSGMVDLGALCLR